MPIQSVRCPPQLAGEARGGGTDGAGRPLDALLDERPVVQDPPDRLVPHDRGQELPFEAGVEPGGLLEVGLHLHPVAGDVLVVRQVDDPDIVVVAEVDAVGQAAVDAVKQLDVLHPVAQAERLAVATDLREVRAGQRDVVRVGDDPAGPEPVAAVVRKPRAEPQVAAVREGARDRT
ncbi:hypothetical protein [Micromonospora rubida]